MVISSRHTNATKLNGFPSDRRFFHAMFRDEILVLCDEQPSFAQMSLVSFAIRSKLRSCNANITDRDLSTSLLVARDLSRFSFYLAPIAGDAQCSAKSNRALEQRPSTTNRVDSLTRLHRCAPSRDALTSRSVFVPRVPTGFPARRYSWLSIIARPPARLRHGLTRSD